jgi:large subunit ribosomal protein L21
MATAKKATKKVTKSADSTTFAVIANGGKQYLVRVGDVLTLEKMAGEFTAGDAITFDQVLLLDDGSTTKLGTPMISGTKVIGEFIEAGRAKKIDVIKYLQKSRYYKKNGHRQPFVKVKITAIS